MPTRQLLGAACAAALLATSLPAWADRSRLADDAELIERGDCELEWALQSERQRHARRHGRSIEINCGIGWQTEVALALQRQRSGAETEAAATIELKTTLVERSGTAIGWSVIANAHRERAQPAPWRWAEQGWSIEASQQPAPGWRLEARLGTLRDRIERRNRTVWELALEHAFAPNWELRAELGGEDHRPPSSALALRWQVWPEVLLLTLKHSVAAAPGRARQNSLALTWEF